MNSNQMDICLDLVPLKSLISFFRRNKSKIAYSMDNSSLFLKQLQDHDLISGYLYQNVLAVENLEGRQEAVYKVLELLEEDPKKNMKRFWSCVFQEHVMERYAFLHKLKTSFLSENSENNKTQPIPEKLTGIVEKKSEEKDDGTKRNKDVDEAVEEDAGCFSVSSSSQKKTMLSCLNSDSSVEEPSRNNEAEWQEMKPKQKQGATWRKKGDEAKPGTSSGLSLNRSATISKSSSLLEKEHISVTCNNKKGLLYPKNLAKGGKCIFSEDQWFTPPEFETFSGMGKCKNWKTSIRYRERPLKKLIKEDRLKCAHCYRGLRQQSGAMNSNQMDICSSVSSSSQKKLMLISSAESINPTKTYKSSVKRGLNIKEKKQMKQINALRKGKKKKQIKIMDMTHFEADVLPVSCGPVIGALHKCRFAGPRSKSIRTAEHWLTPEEFASSHWKKDIQCNGKSLGYLLKMKCLDIHPKGCRCQVCCPKDPLHRDKDYMCFICDNGENLEFCNKCPRAFHHHCHIPNLQNKTKDDWMCIFCMVNLNERLWTSESKDAVYSSPFLRYSMPCEYLLLHLYKMDKQREFQRDPMTEEQTYSVSSYPMSLDKVKTKMENKHYRTVGEFVNDINFIFEPFQTFYQDDNEKGAIMKKIFEKEFAAIFKFQ